MQKSIFISFVMAILCTLVAAVLISLLLPVVSIFFWTVGLGLAAFFLVYLAIVAIAYKKSVYPSLVNVSMWKVFFDIGLFGEYLTVRALEGISSNERFLVNVYVPREDGSSTEIDILYLNEMGIFVLESKNYSGWIFGDDSAKVWTQSLNRNKKNQFFSPVFQNSAHINALKKLLGEDLSYHNVIVFSKRCELKKVTSEKALVVKREQLRQAICDGKYKSALSAEEIAQIAQRLLIYTKVSAEAKAKHIQTIQEKTTAQPPRNEPPQNVLLQEELPQAEKVCPKCGAVMVLRQAKRGENVGKWFWGCSNFPRCRCMIRIEESKSDLSPYSD